MRDYTKEVWLEEMKEKEQEEIIKMIKNCCFANQVVLGQMFEKTFQIFGEAMKHVFSFQTWKNDELQECNSFEELTQKVGSWDPESGDYPPEEEFYIDSCGEIISLYIKLRDADYTQIVFTKVEDNSFSIRSYIVAGWDFSSNYEGWHTKTFLASKVEKNIIEPWCEIGENAIMLPCSLPRKQQGLCFLYDHGVSIEKSLSARLKQEYGLEIDHNGMQRLRPIKAIVDSNDTKEVLGYHFPTSITGTIFEIVDNCVHTLKPVGETKVFYILDPDDETILETKKIVARNDSLMYQKYWVFPKSGFFYTPEQKLPEPEEEEFVEDLSPKREKILKPLYK